MIYLAGDNNLESFAIKDLFEMSRVGSSTNVAIVAQLDRTPDKITRRYFITNGQELDANCVMKLGEMNTGDPKALIDFIIWATQDYPAEQYALILWNHGSGWKDEDIYNISRRQKLITQVTRGQVRGLTGGKTSRALFRSSLESLLIDLAPTQRAILFGDSSADFLDNMELRLVLEKTVELYLRKAIGAVCQPA